MAHALNTLDNNIDHETIDSLIPLPMMHADGEISSNELSDGTIVVSDSISDTYFKKLPNGVYSMMHCDHFGCKTEEDIERLNHECFVNMLKHLDDEELEKARQINGVDAISDLFVFKPSKKHEEDRR